MSSSPGHTIRVAPELWDQFGLAIQAAGETEPNRAKAIRDLMRGYIARTHTDEKDHHVKEV